MPIFLVISALSEMLSHFRFSKAFTPLQAGKKKEGRTGTFAFLYCVILVDGYQ